MPIWGMVIVVGAAALMAGLMVLVARYVSVDRREAHNDVVGFVYAVVGVIYAVVLAMVVIDVLNTLDSAKVNTYAESNALIDLDWYARSLPQPAGAQIEGMTKAYTETVINEEWPLLGRQQSSATAWSQARRLRTAVEAQQPQTLGAQARYQAALQAAGALSSARRQRVNEATEAIPGLLWVALIIGGVVTVGFAFLFGMRGLVAHCAVVFSLTLVVGSLLLLIYELNYPFIGAIRVRPVAFELALNQMGRSD